MSTSPVTVYWRPGCMFCAGLFSSLDRIGLEVERISIWDDERAAAYVRSVAGGNETVPTVTVGEHVLVNPSATAVAQMVADVAPEHLPEGYEPPTSGSVGRLLNRMLGGASRLRQM